MADINSINGNRIVPSDGTVGTSALADEAVTSTKIADGAVTEVNVADNAVSDGKLAIGGVADLVDSDKVIAEYGADLLTTASYIDKNGAVQAIDQSYDWYVSDLIELTDDMLGKEFFYAGKVQKYGSYNTMNVAFYVDDPVIEDKVWVMRTYGTDESTPSSGQLGYVCGRVPFTARWMRLCGAKTSMPFSLKVIMGSASMLHDGSRLLDGRLFKELGGYVPKAANGYIDTSGAFVAATNQTLYYTSDLIDVEHFNTVEYDGMTGKNASLLASYDAGGGVLDVVPCTASGEQHLTGTLDISDAKYVRVCARIAHNTTSIHLDQNYFVAYNRHNGDGEPERPFDHNVNKPFDFAGKVAAFCGDSITKGYVDGSTTTVNCYPKLFSDKVGMSFANLAVGGATVARYTGKNCIQDQVATALEAATDYDFIFVAGGVNDWQLGITLSDYRAALESICDAAEDAGFTGELVFIAPINEAGRAPANTPDAPLDYFRDTVKEVATINGHSVLNGRLFDFPTRTSSAEAIAALIPDRLHPSEAGYRLYAKGLQTVLC